jgi:hypothetical protein
MASSFLSYAFHYVILRTLYSGARDAGVSPVVLVLVGVGGIALLALLGGSGQARYRRGGGGFWREYRSERGRLRARRRERDGREQGR